MDSFAAYAPALVALGGFTVVMFVISFFATSIALKHGLQQGEVPAADYSSAAFRAYRAFQNAQEGMLMFLPALVVAMLAGAPSFWVNLLAWVYLLARIVVAFVHIRGIGQPSGGLRSQVFFVCLLALFGILALGLGAALF